MAEKGQLVDFRDGADKITGISNKAINFFTSLNGEVNKTALVIWAGTGKEEFGHGLSNFTFDTHGNIKTELVYEIESLRSIPQKLQNAEQYLTKVKSANDSIPQRMQDAFEKFYRDTMASAPAILTEDEIFQIIIDKGWRPTEHYSMSDVEETSSIIASALEHLEGVQKTAENAANQIVQTDLDLAALIGASLTEGPLTSR